MTEMPRYSEEDLFLFYNDLQDEQLTNDAIARIPDISLAAEVHRFCCINKGLAAAEEELDRRMLILHKIRMDRHACVIRLQMADVVSRIKAQADPRCFGHLLHEAREAARSGARP